MGLPMQPSGGNWPGGPPRTSPAKTRPSRNVPIPPSTPTPPKIGGSEGGGEGLNPGWIPRGKRRPVGRRAWGFFLEKRSRRPGIGAMRRDSAGGSCPSRRGSKPSGGNSAKRDRVPKRLLFSLRAAQRSAPEPWIAPEGKHPQVRSPGTGACGGGGGGEGLNPGWIPRGKRRPVGRRAWGFFLEKRSRRPGIGAMRRDSAGGSCPSRRGSKPSGGNSAKRDRVPKRLLFSLRAAQRSAPEPWIAPEGKHPQVRSPGRRACGGEGIVAGERFPLRVAIQSGTLP